MRKGGAQSFCYRREGREGIGVRGNEENTVVLSVDGIRRGASAVPCQRHCDTRPLVLQPSRVRADDFSELMCHVPSEAKN